MSTDIDSLAWLCGPINRVLGSEDPAKAAADMLVQADRSVAAHKHLIATYGTTAAPSLTAELLDGASFTAMMILLMAETVIALLPAKSATMDEVSAAFLALEPRMGEFRARARVLDVSSQGGEG